MPAVFLLSSLATAAGTGMQMYGQKQAGDAAAAAADYNNELAKAEARNLELEATEGIKRERENNRAQLSDLRNRMAGTGFVTTSGAPLLLAGETAGRFELGIADAARSASMQSASLRAQGKMGLWEGQQAKRSSRITMIGTGLRGVASLGGQYQQGKREGII